MRVSLRTAWAVRRSSPWAVYRLAIIGVVVLLAAVTLMFLRGPEAWQRQYYQMEYREVIDAVAVRQEVNPFLIASVIDAESDWEPNALSSVGAVGLMQVMPSTAEELAERGLVDAKRFPAEDLHVPGVNIEYGAAYLRYLVERYHEVETALAAYNAGLANVDQWAARGGDIRAQIEFPATRHFVLKVVRGKDRYEALYPDSFTDWSSR